MSHTQKIIFGAIWGVVFIGVIFFFTGESETKVVQDEKLSSSTVPQKSQETYNRDEPSAVLEKEEQADEVFLSEGGNALEAEGGNVDDMLAELLQMSHVSNQNNYRLRNETKQELVTLVKGDNTALEKVLSSYQNNLDNDEIKEDLFQVLSEVHHPQVEKMAQELASSSDRDAQIAGFELLGELKVPSQENLDRSLQTLEHSQGDEELSLAALHAMTQMPLSSEDNQNVINTLNNLAKNENEAIRSESLLNLAQWAKSEDDLGVVIDALDSEVVDDKISAAMALERSPVVGDNLKASLLEKIQDDNELWEVRSMSANALGRFDLNSNEFSSLQSFREKQQGGVAH